MDVLVVEALFSMMQTLMFDFETIVKTSHRTCHLSYWTNIQDGDIDNFGFSNLRKYMEP